MKTADLPASGDEIAGESDAPRSLPGLARMGANFARALARHVAGGMQNVDAAQYKARLAVCDTCPLKANDRCLQCGCFLSKKAQWRSEHCPLGKWPALPVLDAPRVAAEQATAASSATMAPPPEMPHPRVRRDLIVTEQAGDRGPIFLLQNPTTNSFARFGQVEHFLAGRMDGTRSLDDIRRQAEGRFGASLSEATLKRFIAKLWDLKLLESTRNAAPPPAGIVRGSLLHLRIRLIDPDRLLQAMLPWTGWIFTRAFLIVTALLILLAACLVAFQGAALRSEIPGLLHPQAIMSGLVVIFAVTFAHELAHGLTCRYFGGPVREIGFLLIYFNPAFYCDVSSAWRFPKKSQRLLVTFAGAYLELILWALAVFAWWGTEPQAWVHQLSLMVTVASGIKSFFNLNPLIKLDGYYLLSDWWDIPNLRQKAFDFVRMRFGWGVEQDVAATRASPREVRMLWIYGLTAATYSGGLLTFMAYKVGGFLMTNFQAIGMFVFALMLTAAFPQQAAQMARWPLTAWRAGGLRRLAGPLKLAGLMAGAVVLLALVSIDLKVTGEVAILPAQKAELRAGVAGFVDEVLAEEGQSVTPGALLLRLDDPAQRATLAEVEARIRQQQAQLALLRIGARREEVNLAQGQVATAQTRAEHAALRLAEARRMQAQRTAQVKATVATAQAELAFAQAKLQRLLPLAERSVVTRQDLDQAKADVAVRSSQLAEAQAQQQVQLADNLTQFSEAVALAEREHAEAQGRLAILSAGVRPEVVDAAEAELARLEGQRSHLAQQLERFNVTSPIAGMVVTKKLRDKVGRHVEQGELLAEVHELQTVCAETLVPESEIGEVQASQQVAVKLRAYPDQTFQGQVLSIGATTSAATEPDATQMVLVTVQLDNSAGLLKPGMSGKAKIRTGGQTLLSQLHRRMARTVKVEFWSWW